MTVTMRLCGLDIPNEGIYYEKVASNRIHNFAEETDNLAVLLDYDNADIAGALSSTVENAQGIWKAVQQRKCFDIEKKPINDVTVIQELNILSVDLEKIAMAVQSTLTSEAGQKRWPKVAPLLHPEQPCIPIPDAIRALTEMSQKFKTFAETSMKLQY